MQEPPAEIPKGEAEKQCPGSIRTGLASWGPPEGCRSVMLLIAQYFLVLDSVKIQEVIASGLLQKRLFLFLAVVSLSPPSWPKAACQPRSPRAQNQEASRHCKAGRRRPAGSPLKASSWENVLQGSTFNDASELCCVQGWPTRPLCLATSCQRAELCSAAPASWARFTFTSWSPERNWHVHQAIATPSSHMPCRRQKLLLIYTKDNAIPQLRIPNLHT